MKIISKNNAFCGDNVMIHKKGYYEMSLCPDALEILCDAVSDELGRDAFLVAVICRKVVISEIVDRYELRCNYIIDSGLTDEQWKAVFVTEDGIFHKCELTW